MPDKPRRRPLAAAGAVLGCGLAAATALAGTAPGSSAAPPPASSSSRPTAAPATLSRPPVRAARWGPDLDRLSLTEQTIIEQVQVRRPGADGKAAPTTQMVAYRGVLSSTQIDNVAAFVYTAEHR